MDTLQKVIILYSPGTNGDYWVAMSPEFIALFQEWAASHHAEVEFQEI